jgi:DNA-binding NarL/FixJ family response regulator
MSEKIRILIADDHPIVRQGLRQTIAGADDIEVVAEAGDGAEALAAARAMRPRIIVLDIGLPTLDGLQVARLMREEEIDAKVIFLTVHREESFMQKALGLGAAGYVLKDSAVTDIVAAIRAAAAGLPYISPAMTAHLIKERAAAPGVEGLDTLTPAERRVLRLISQYKTTKEIAEALFISPRTVESHRASITQKLGLRGSHSLMRYALQHLSELERE